MNFKSGDMVLGYPGTKVPMPGVIDKIEESVLNESEFYVIVRHPFGILWAYEPGQTSPLTREGMEKFLMEFPKQVREFWAPFDDTKLPRINGEMMDKAQIAAMELVDTLKEVEEPAKVTHERVVINPLGNYPRWVFALLVIFRMCAYLLAAWALLAAADWWAPVIYWVIVAGMVIEGDRAIRHLFFEDWSDEKHS